MKYVSREQFFEEVPRKRLEREVLGEQRGDLTVDGDTHVRAIVEGDVRVRSGSQALIAGVVHGSLIVEPGASAYLTGVVDGDMRVDGDALLIGVVRGVVRGGDDSLFATGGREWITQMPLAGRERA